MLSCVKFICLWASKQKDTAANVAESAVTKKPKQVKQLKKAVGRVETENKKPRKNAAAVMRSSEVTAKKTTSKPRRKKDQTANSAAEVSELNSADGYPCTLCGIVYGAHDDPKKSEEWWPCKNCGREFHQSCAQTTGVCIGAFLKVSWLTGCKLLCLPRLRDVRLGSLTESLNSFKASLDEIPVSLS